MKEGVEGEKVKPPLEGKSRPCGDAQLRPAQGPPAWQGSWRRRGDLRHRGTRWRRAGGESSRRAGPGRREGREEAVREGGPWTPARPRRGPLPAPPRSLHLPLPLDAVLVPFRQAQQLLQQSQLLRARPRGSRHLWRRTTWERKGSDDRHLTTTANPIGRRGNHTAEGTVAAIGLKEPASQSEGRRVPRML